MESFFSNRINQSKKPFEEIIITDEDYIKCYQNPILHEIPPIPDNKVPKPINQNNNNMKYKKVRGCGFCKQNGEMYEIYSTHSIKDELGRVTCPVLQKWKCSLCNATGENAHTITYCPLVLMSNNGNKLASGSLAIKNTMLKSNGNIRLPPQI